MSGLYLNSHNGPPDFVDPISIVKGDVPSQLLKVKLSRNVIIDKFMMKEHILVDNYFNIYFVYDAKLSDGDTYSHGMRLKPSKVAEGGGSNPENVEPYLSDDNIKKCRLDALTTFSRTQHAIFKGSKKESKNGNIIIPENFSK